MLQPRYRKPQKLKELKKQALALYKTGLSYRQVGEVIGRSYEWVRLAVNELDKVPSK